MPDGTMESLAHLKKISERACISHSEEENKKAVDDGVESAKASVNKGNAIMMMDEFQFGMSDLDFSRAVGWNSVVFSDENKALLEKMKEPKSD